MIPNLSLLVCSIHVRLWPMEEVLFRTNCVMDLRYVSSIRPGCCEALTGCVAHLIPRVVKLSITLPKSLGSMSYMETKSNRSYPKMVFQVMSGQREDERSRQMLLVLALGSR